MYKKYLKREAIALSDRFPKYILVMKLTVVLLLFFVQVSVGGLAQEVTLKVNNMPIKDVFHQLSLKTGYNFIAGSKVIDGLPNVSLDVKNEPLTSVLGQFLDSRKVEIVFGSDKTIIIKSRSPKSRMGIGSEASCRSPEPRCAWDRS